MLRLALVAALLVPAGIGVGFLPSDHPDDPSPPRPHLGHVRTIDVSALPLPNGYALVPIAASGTTAFELDIRVLEVTPRGTGYADAMLFGNPEQGYSGGAGSGAAEPLLDASAKGRAVRCCEAPPGLPVSTSWGGGEGSVSGDLPAGQHWLVLMVADARTYDVEVTLRTALDVVAVGEPVVGTSVQSFDLVSEARATTTRVAAGPLALSSPGGAAERAWTSHGYGFLSFSAYAQGGPSADLAVELPVLGAQDVRLDDLFAHAFVLAPGDVRLSLSALDEGTLRLLPGVGPGGSGVIMARGMYADLPLEGHLHSWDAQPIEG